MNIKEAKQEISHTLQAYLEKDELGNYCYTLVRQRPILLMGPPGIGKTAIMEQVAEENGVGLVSYTITHHTRQSAIGLPRIREKVYDGKRMSVTEYTMSEIIDSVYACMERTGKKEGILFIDEINCASETLAPTMLQFLQNKTFGSHKVPDGWMIVAAGNPPEYNKSVREFDIVTLDRVRKIDIEADCDIWMEYAWKHQVHGAILSYLNIRKEDFYRVENTVDGKFFVTARGWEDLSELLKSYERLKIPVSDQLVIQFLQQEEVAGKFTAYYQLYTKYGQDYGICELLDGTLPEERKAEKQQMAVNGGFEERFTVTGLMLDALNDRFETVSELEKRLHMLHDALKYWKNYQPEKKENDCLADFIQEKKNQRQVRQDSGMLTVQEAKREQWMAGRLEAYEQRLKEAHIRSREEGFEKIRGWFAEEVEHKKAAETAAGQCLDRAFSFLEDAFGDGQEMILFVTELSKNEKIMAYISSHGCEAYFRYSDLLLYRKREAELRKDCEELSTDPA